MNKFLLLLMVMTVFGSFGGFFFKKAISQSKTIFNVIFKPMLYIGGMLYVLSAILNIVVLKKINYTIVLPVTSITYIWSMLISYVFLKEKMTNKKIIGVILIIVGSAMVAALK